MSFHTITEIWHGGRREHSLLKADGWVFSTEPAPMYSDDYIDLWAEIWRANHLAEAGISLLAFLANPQGLLLEWSTRKALATPDAGEGLRPLLPDQKRVAVRALRGDLYGDLAERLEAEVDALAPNMRRSNGTPVEPMRHTTWPRHADKRRASA